MYHLLYLMFRCDEKFGFWEGFGASKHTQEVPDLAAPSTLVPNGTCSISTGGNGTDYDYRVQAGKNPVHPGAGAHS